MRDPDIAGTWDGKQWRYTVIERPTDATTPEQPRTAFDVLTEAWRLTSLDAFIATLHKNGYEISPIEPISERDRTDAEVKRVFAQARPAVASEGLRAALDSIALEVYSGLERPPSDAGQLLAIADWLDRIDDKTDAATTLAGKDHRVTREVQADLRRIAAALASDTGRSVGALDVERLARALLLNVHWDQKDSRFALYEDDGPEVLAQRIAAAYDAEGDG